MRCTGVSIRGRRRGWARSSLSAGWVKSASSTGLGCNKPFNIVLTYTIGCGSRTLIDRIRGDEFVDNIGIPVAAGLIVGEALVGVGTAMAQIFGVAGM